jgi:hypothetical protein
MKTKTHIKAGKLSANHNEKVVCGVRVKSNIKAGRIALNHSETLVRG